MTQDLEEHKKLNLHEFYASHHRPFPRSRCLRNARDLERLTHRVARVPVLQDQRLSCQTRIHQQVPILFRARWQIAPRRQCRHRLPIRSAEDYSHEGP